MRIIEKWQSSNEELSVVATIDSIHETVGEAKTQFQLLLNVYWRK